MGTDPRISSRDRALHAEPAPSLLASLRAGAAALPRLLRRIVGGQKSGASANTPDTLFLTKATARLHVRLARPPTAGSVDVELHRRLDAAPFRGQPTGCDADTIFEDLAPGTCWVVGTQGGQVVTTRKAVELLAGQTQGVELDWLVVRRTASQ